MDESNDAPLTVSEAVNRLLSELPITTKQQIANLTEDDLINLHFGLGMSIRNEFALWQKDSSLLNDCRKVYPGTDPDTASGIIIKALWSRLQNFPPPKVVRDDS